MSGRSNTGSDAQAKCLRHRLHRRRPFVLRASAQFKADRWLSATRAETLRCMFPPSMLLFDGEDMVYAFRSLSHAERAIEAFDLVHDY